MSASVRKGYIVNPQWNNTFHAVTKYILSILSSLNHSSSRFHSLYLLLLFSFLQSLNFSSHSPTSPPLFINILILILLSLLFSLSLPTISFLSSRSPPFLLPNSFPPFFLFLCFYLILSSLVVLLLFFLSPYSIFLYLHTIFLFFYLILSFPSPSSSFIPHT